LPIGSAVVRKHTDTQEALTHNGFTVIDEVFVNREAPG
jgi:hypothetical protein